MSFLSCISFWKHYLKFPSLKHYLEFPTIWKHYPEFPELHLELEALPWVSWAASPSGSTTLSFLICISIWRHYLEFPAIWKHFLEFPAIWTHYLSFLRFGSITWVSCDLEAIPWVSWAASRSGSEEMRWCQRAWAPRGGRWPPAGPGSCCPAWSHPEQGK